MFNPPNPAGSLQVTISPAGAIAAGAQWQVDDGISQSSGATVLGLSVGNHTVSFNLVGDWIPPANQTVYVSANSTATAIGDYTEFTYATNADNTLTITGYSGPGGAVTIPTNITGLTVSSIGSLTFISCASLTSVTIGNSVTSIGMFAFYWCANLTNVTIGANVTNFAFGAIDGCGPMNVYFQGNAPNDASMFTYDSATVYYLPGTTGWATFSGLPTALWLPKIIGCSTRSVGQPNQFGFNINWAGGRVVVVEACTNLFNPVWRPVQTNTLAGGSCYFSDPAGTNYPARFYRLRSP
jgi:hypothetical protein